jgi:hypothetical protein
MRNLIGVAAALTASLYFTTPIPASAGSANQGPGWGAVVGAGILGGIIGGATAPPPQQIIVVPERQAPPPANIIVVVPPGYQPPQAQTQAQKWHDALAAHCIGGSFVDGVLTVINDCQQPVAVYWGLGNFHSGGEVAFTVPTIVLPAGGARQIVAATFSYTGDISWTACPVGMRVVDAMTGHRLTGIRLAPLWAAAET